MGRRPARGFRHVAKGPPDDMSMCIYIGATKQCVHVCPDYTFLLSSHTYVLSEATRYYLPTTNWPGFVYVFDGSNKRDHRGGSSDFCPRLFFLCVLSLKSPSSPPPRVSLGSLGPCGARPTRSHTKWPPFVLFFFSGPYPHVLFFLSPPYMHTGGITEYYLHDLACLSFT
mgnify:CR=1 FL=1